MFQGLIGMILLALGLVTAGSPSLVIPTALIFTGAILMLRASREMEKEEEQ